MIPVSSLCVHLCMCVCSASTLEFVLQLCFNALASASRAVLHSETAKAAVQSAYDVDVVVKCIQSTFLLVAVLCWRGVT